MKEKSEENDCDELYWVNYNGFSDPRLLGCFFVVVVVAAEYDSPSLTQLLLLLLLRRVLILSIHHGERSVCREDWPPPLCLSVSLSLSLSLASSLSAFLRLQRRGEKNKKNLRFFSTTPSRLDSRIGPDRRLLGFYWISIPKKNRKTCSSSSDGFEHVCAGFYRVSIVVFFMALVRDRDMTLFDGRSFRSLANERFESGVCPGHFVQPLF